MSIFAGQTLRKISSSSSSTCNPYGFGVDTVVSGCEAFGLLVVPILIAVPGCWLVPLRTALLLTLLVVVRSPDLLPRRAMIFNNMMNDTTPRK